MAVAKISTDQDALALANVVNPGGQRMNTDGSISPSLAFHGTNCAIVALSVAAFLADGTESSAYAAPSALLYSGQSYLIGLVTSYSKFGSRDIDAPRIEVNEPPASDESRLKELLSHVKEYTAKYPGQNFLIHGISTSGHHWFNMTSEGTFVDAQIGLTGDELLLGQYAHDGVRYFKYLEIFPVDQTLSGPTILDNAQALHQYNAMVDLVRFMNRNLEYEKQVDIRTLIGEIVTPDKDQQVAQGNFNIGLLSNEKTDKWFNKFCDLLVTQHTKEGNDGRQAVIDRLVAALTPTDERRVEGVNQTWLSESRFRKAGSIEPTPSVVDVFQDRCPILKEALKIVRGLDRALDDRSGFSGR